MATTSSTTASLRLLQHQDRANFPFLACNIVETATGKPPAWVQASTVLLVNGVKVGVIGAALEDTPELVAAGNTAGLTFLPAVSSIRAELLRLTRQGVRVQIVLMHEGSSGGSERSGWPGSCAMDRARDRTSPRGCRIRRWMSSSAVTHIV